ncbi:unnamed protein product [Ectocarpus sp. CCAP 1310/34]|nr:unnamed protein product [Ectocarpus sp. CCAP 1310/34]
MTEAGDASSTQPNANDTSHAIDRSDIINGKEQTTVGKIAEGDGDDNEDRRRNQQSHEKLEAGKPSTMVAPEPENKKIDPVSGERQKLDRRKRRCPVGTCGEPL